MADSQQPTSAISPREVANKSDKKHLLRAIRMTLEIQSPAVRHNTQTFNRNRYKATAALPDYDALKDEARKIKENAIAHLPHLISTLENVSRMVRSEPAKLRQKEMRAVSCREAEAATECRPQPIAIPPAKRIAAKHFSSSVDAG